MKQTYSTPKMIVHGNLEKLTQAAGNRAFKDLLVFNGRVVETNDDSLDVNCGPTGQDCTKSPAKP
ncbi:MAG: lasso peptide [Pelatocladus maniniholoensis HA4357-MV3]|jgi:hypothetical protein|uniref:Lasso peptide n=1 Tax=Pelatocladus maniniholoensis HA4357-MV3 TaxID=1117104 RepID=A0A9E3LS16_9NOST|nr:lasso peptide [Pelatocladus maniniholoensis HA4357-MV3]BAZ65656.1 hypothetical protein NIES4106_03960 [Fischerella sp. NIES-4106]